MCHFFLNKFFLYLDGVFSNKKKNFHPYLGSNLGRFCRFCFCRVCFCQQVVGDDFASCVVRYCMKHAKVLGVVLVTMLAHVLWAAACSKSTQRCWPPLFWRCSKLVQPANVYVHSHHLSIAQISETVSKWFLSDCQITQICHQISKNRF